MLTGLPRALAPALALAAAVVAVVLLAGASARIRRGFGEAFAPQGGARGLADIMAVGGDRNILRRSRPPWLAAPSRYDGGLSGFYFRTDPALSGGEHDNCDTAPAACAGFRL